MKNRTLALSFVVLTLVACEKKPDAPAAPKPAPATPAPTAPAAATPAPTQPAAPPATAQPTAPPTAPATQPASAVPPAVAPPPTAAAPDVESKDILARTTVAENVSVKHVLIAWKDLAAAFHGHLDPRAAARSEADAAKLATDMVAKIKAGTKIEDLMKEFSEDPGSAASGRAYPLSADAPMVPPFKNLGLRLNVNEVGIVKSNYGFHIMQRMADPVPDPLESKEILARAPVTQSCDVKHVLIGWKDLAGSYHGHMDPRAAARTKEEADKLAVEIMNKIKGGAAIEDLMKSTSEDPGSAATGNSYPVTPDAGLVPPFKKLSLRLNEGEVGMVITDFGWHVIKRVPAAAAPPAPPAPPAAPPAHP